MTHEQLKPMRATVKREIKDYERQMAGALTEIRWTYLDKIDALEWVLHEVLKP